MASLTIKLPDHVKSRVEAEARLAGRSVSAYIRDLLDRPARTAKKPSLHDLAGDLCGAGDSGQPDLATNPAHLRGFGE